MAYFVVNHATDEDKTDGLVESYQMINVEIEQADGSIAIIPKRLNFVHWPSIPVPFVHEEWSESLVFTNVYVPEEDNTDEDEDEDYDDNELNDTIVELLENDYPEIYKVLLSEAEQEIEAQAEYEDEEDEEEEEEDQATI